MAVDNFTEALRALTFGLSVAFLLLVAECVRYWFVRRRRRRALSKLYDWQKECPELRPELPRSHVRVVGLIHRWK
jgi:hypothetical protein